MLGGALRLRLVVEVARTAKARAEAECAVEAVARAAEARAEAARVLPRLGRRARRRRATEEARATEAHAAAVRAAPPAEARTVAQSRPRAASTGAGIGFLTPEEPPPVAEGSIVGAARAALAVGAHAAARATAERAAERAAAAAFRVAPAVGRSGERGVLASLGEAQALVDALVGGGAWGAAVTVGDLVGFTQELARAHLAIVEATYRASVDPRREE